MTQSPSDEKTERQLALVLLLTSTSRPLTRDEIQSAIREYQGVSDTAFQRSFERDKKELREIGVPVSLVETIDGESAYVIRNSDAKLKPLRLDDTERLALSLAARAWGSAAWSASARSGLGKLEAAGEFDAPTLDAFDVTPGPGSDLVEAALVAIQDRQAITFEYLKPSEPSPSTRTVDPWAVVALRGRWYLVGRDHDRGAERSFRLSRVRGSLRRTGRRQSFDIPGGLDPANEIKTEFGDTVDATVLVAPGTGHAIRALGEVTLDDDGWDRVDVKRARSDRLIADILRAGSSAIVEEPEWLVAKVQRRLSLIANEPSSASPLSDEDLAELRRPDHEPRRAAPIATARLARLLSVIPWLRAHPGASVATTARHFDMGEEDLRSDLLLATCTEFGPWHTTVDIDLGGPTIVVREAHGVDAPPPLGRAEVVALLLGLRLLGGIAAEGSSEIIAGLERKLTEAAAEGGAELPEVAVVDSAPGCGEISTRVLAALERGRALRLEYWSAVRDVVSERVVDPVRMWQADGITYLTAWCRQAGSTRSFRIDRIRNCEILAEPARVAPPTSLASESPAAEDAILLLDSDAAWLAESVRDGRSSRLPGGRVALSFPVTSDRWVLRTVMSLAGRARVIEPRRLADAVTAAAAEALAGYGSDAPVRTPLAD